MLPLVDSKEYFSPGNSLWVGLPDKEYQLMTVEEVTEEIKTGIDSFSGSFCLLASCQRKYRVFFWL